MSKKKEINNDEQTIDGEVYVEMKYLDNTKNKDIYSKDEYYWQSNPLEKQNLIHYKLNNNYLYFLSDLDIKSVISGIPLSELITKGD